LIEDVDDNNIAEVLDIVGKHPLDNIILIADITQLKDRCDVKLLRENHEIMSVFALYKDLDFLAGAFWTRDSDSLQRIIVSYGETLQKANIVFICTNEQLELLEQVAAAVNPIKERRMVIHDSLQLECEVVAPSVRLTMSDIDEMREIYRLSGTPAWTPNALDYGPFFGVRNKEGELVSIAGVHFVTEYGAEIGNIATHPKYRRKGYAACCTAAVTKELLKGSACVFLHFFDDNIAAKKLYEKMGFVYSDSDPVFFTKTILK
jgi:ribosomal protein S18 acetylase RimI-like enzyme